MDRASIQGKASGCLLENVFCPLLSSPGLFKDFTRALPECLHRETRTGKRWKAPRHTKYLTKYLSKLFDTDSFMGKQQ